MKIGPWVARKGDARAQLYTQLVATADTSFPPPGPQGAGLPSSWTDRGWCCELCAQLEYGATFVPGACEFFAYKYLLNICRAPAYGRWGKRGCRSAMSGCNQRGKRVDRAVVRASDWVHTHK